MAMQPGGLTSISRRRAAAWLGMTVPTLALVGTSRAATPAPTGTGAAATATQLRFDVLRKGDKIGEHLLDFTPTAEGQRVASRIELVIKVAFITVYRYRQDGEDEWRRDMLARTRIDTDDNGTTSHVAAELAADRLRVEGPKGSFELAPGTMTDLSFWNLAITTQRQLVDSQTGEPIPVEVRPEASERVLVRGAEVAARRFAMTGSKSRSGTIWYDDAGRLVKAVVITRGEQLDYELAG